MRPWVLLACTLGASCATAPADRKTGPDRRAADYAPLKVGASWTYAVRFQGQSGERTVMIVRVDDGYFVDDQNGSMRLTAEGLRDRDRYLIRHPLVPGTSWKSIVSASAVEVYEIVSVGEPCEARAGAFEDCLVVTSKLRRDREMALHVTFTWAKGVGLVKIETAAEVAGKGRIPQTEQSLIHYSFSGKALGGAGNDDGPNTWGR